jgi:hypothetical protein
VPGDRGDAPLFDPAQLRAIRRDVCTSGEPRSLSEALFIFTTWLALIMNNKAHPTENITILRVKPNPSAGLTTGGPPPKPKYLILPPVEYDHPYEGNLTIETVATVDELLAECRNTKPRIIGSLILARRPVGSSWSTRRSCPQEGGGGRSCSATR